jgi:hypothetical protein
VIRRTRAYRWHFGERESLGSLEDRTYLATHVVYVLSDFNQSRLPEALLRPVVRHLERAAPHYLAADDVETLGEVADALKIVGRTYRCPLVRRIVAHLLRRQNQDGSWGDPKTRDSYRRYHTTWTAFNGLLEYRFTRRGIQDPVIRQAWTAPPSPATKSARPAANPPRRR